MDSIADVDIDPEGVFKYIQIVVNDGARSKTIVRGYAADEYHADIYDRVTPSLERAKLKHHCPGGGRIKHEKGKSLFVYGYSQGFGRADHAETVRLLQQQYPSYEISFSNTGY
eukprot:m.240232 g.240232  ORF g.240232 m.240232 type:complete len:113 (-) comp23200_c0_seq1:26-364(-)